MAANEDQMRNGQILLKNCKPQRRSEQHNLPWMLRMRVLSSLNLTCPGAGGNWREFGNGCGKLRGLSSSNNHLAHLLNRLGKVGT